MNSGFEFDPETAFRIVNKHLKFQGKVGYFEDSPTYPDGQKPGYIARLMEYGVPQFNIPARPFMAFTVKRNREAWNRFISRNFRGKEYSYPLAVRFCETVRQDIKTEIEIGDFAPNSPSTIKKKKSDRPLVDTGHLMESIIYKIIAEH